MKGKLLITVMLGLLSLPFLSSIAVAAGLPECTNNLNICTTNLTNAQTSLATCQATVAECIQKPSFPSWDKKLACDSTSNCPRFEVLADWNKEAVLDKETGLVWEKSPSTSTSGWDLAVSHCASLEVSGRKGWHLPTIEQLASLVDTSVPGSIKLPEGHPFADVKSDERYWSATTDPRITTLAMNVGFNIGSTGSLIKSGIPIYTWCVRGGQSYDAY